MNFCIRAEQIQKKFANYIKRNEKKILSSGWDIGYEKIRLVKKHIKFEIAPSDVLSWLNMTIYFSREEDLLLDLEEVSEEILSILDVFYREVPDVKITVDIKYSRSKELDSAMDMFQKVVLDIGYEPKKTSRNEYRRFEIIKKHNITNHISTRDMQNSIEYSISVSVENIVIDMSKLKSELVNSLYFFAIEYIKLHYNIISNKDKYYIESNAKFYESLLKLI